MRGLKIAVVVMGVMIVVATVALVIGIVQKTNRAVTGASGGASTVLAPAESMATVAALTTDLALRQPPGTRIGQIATVQGLLAIWVERPDGGRILMVDPTGQQAAREIRLGE